MNVLNLINTKMKTTIFKNWQTSLIGLITIILSGLVLFGKITPEQSVSVGEYVTSIVSAIAGLVLIFKAKD
jgi:hypothetical protein